ncbi:helix-turn-helix domain-containing protein [Enterococcus sp. LJL51]|uniref:helix-turn-helix domain-containing protein n=1 Tax=Enterococcus sp. LJL51 TaxID=3416656 RepID=UPI003CE87B07
MLFDELMMDNSTLIKFQIYKKISSLNQTIIPVSQVAKLFDLSYQQTLIILTEINQEIMAYNNKQSSILKKAGKINAEHLTISIDEYRYLTLKKSIPFLFILYFLNHDQPTIEDFCERHYVSQSTVSRKMIPLKKHVKQFNLRFSFREANLTGDERVVRVALFNTLWLGTRGLFWPFTRVSREEAEKLVHDFSEYFPLTRTYLGLRELSFFAAIFLSRAQKKFFVSYDSNYDFLMKDNPYYDFKRLNKSLGPVKALPPAIAKGESSFIFFLAHYAPFYTMQDDPSLYQTLFDFSKQDNEVIHFVDAFLNYSQKEFFYNQPEIKKDPLLKGNLLNIFFVYYVLRHPFPNLQSLVVDSENRMPKVEKQLEQVILRFLENKLNDSAYPYLSKIQKPLTKSLKNLMLPYCNQFQCSKVIKVGIAFEHNFLLIRNLYQFLNQLDFVEVTPYIDKLTHKYDLVISSSLLPLETYPTLPLHCMDLSYGDEELAHLYVRLHRLYKEKNAAFDY